MGHVRAVGYARISKDDLRQGNGVQRQEQGIRTYAEREGWELVDVLSDNDLSASKYATKPRPGYERFLHLARSGAVERAVIYRVDRLLRIPTELEALIILVEELGGAFRVEALKGRLDLTTAEGLKYARDRVNDAAFESDLLSERLRDSFDQHAAAGQPWSVRAFGYACMSLRPCEGAGCCHGQHCDHIPRHKRCCRIPGCPHDGMTVIEREADLLRQAAAAVKAGESLNMIARGWNTVSVLLMASGHAPVLGPQGGKRWSSTNVRSVLTGYRQAGLRVHRRGTDEEAVFPGAWDAILDRGDHEALRRMLLEDPDRKAKHPPRRQAFTGIIRAEGGEAMSRDLVRGHRVYRPRRHGGVGAHVAIRAEPLERFIEELLFARAESGNLVERVAARRSQAQRIHHGEDPAVIEREILQAAEDEASGLITRPVWLAKHQRLQGRLAKAQAIAQANGHDPALDGITANLRDEWSSLSNDRKRAILGAVFEQVVVLPAGNVGGRRLTAEVVAERVRVTWRI